MSFFRSVLQAGSSRSDRPPSSFQGRFCVKALRSHEAAGGREGRGRAHYFYCLFWVWLIFFACSIPGLAAPAPGSGGDAANSKEDVPSWITPSPYVYDSTGKPDPFLPFIRKVAEERLTPASTEGDRPRTPLEQVEVRELRLEGIIWNADAPDSAMAMVELPDGKGFILRTGMVVGKRQGTVEKIGQDLVSVRERYVTLFGEEKERDVVLKLYSGDGKKQ